MPGRGSKLGYDNILRFGKYKGSTVAKVLANDPQYLLWCERNIGWFELRYDVKAVALDAENMKQERMVMVGAYDFEIERDDEPFEEMYRDPDEGDR